MPPPHPTAAAIARYRDFQHGFGVPTAAAIGGRSRAPPRRLCGAALPDRTARAGSDDVNTLLFVGLETLAYMLLGMACLKIGHADRRMAGAALSRWSRSASAPASPPLPRSPGICVARAFRDVSGRARRHRAADAVPAADDHRLGEPDHPARATRRGLATRIAAAGRMAFSNYLGTSACLHDAVLRLRVRAVRPSRRAPNSIGVVFAVWALMLLWSRPWLAHFRYGPLEWVWRSLARMRLQPMRGAALPSG